MDIHFVTPDLRRLDELKAEAIVLPLFENVRPLRGASGLVDWRLAGLLSRVLVRRYATGALGEVVLIPPRHRLPFEKLLLVGAGTIETFDVARFEALLDKTLTVLDRARVRTSVMVLPGRSVGRMPPDLAMQLFLRYASAHPDQDAATLIEDIDSQKAMQPLIERERRRARAEDEA
ncbi:MAG: M17 family peptidase N-terminal domain-containing protein [Sandaracinaceae bacterium]